MTIYTDDFNRANGDLADNANWENVYNAVEVDSNELNPDGANTSYARWVGGGTWGRTQEVSIEIGSFAGNTSVGPMAYVTASGGYALLGNPSNGAATIRTWDGSGNDSFLGAGENIGTLVTGDELKLRVEDDGNGDTLLTAYLNGVEQFTRVDSTFTSGNPGVFMAAFTNTAADNWSANDFAAAATATVTATVTDQSGTALTNETGISWHWSDSFSGTPTDSGSSETTDGSGVIEVEVPNTGLSSGQFGYLTVKLSNGNVGIAREAID